MMLKRIVLVGCVLCLSILAGCATGSSWNPFYLADRDNDGVGNQIDRCPATPAGVAVDINGCPADSDGDGVFDVLDRCPGTANARGVDLHGCNMDEDVDGVFDWRDHCLQSQAGVAVDLDGCAVVAEIVADLKSAPTPIVSVPADRKLVIYFESDQSTVLPEFHPMVEKLAAGLAPDQVKEVKVSGHTDSTGSKSYNLKLGQRRALRTAALLAASAPQLTPLMSMESFGEAQPVADNGTPMGRLLNRRVEIRVGMAANHEIATSPAE